MAKVGGITTGTAGNVLFLSDTAGGYSATTGSVSQKVAIELGGDVLVAGVSTKVGEILVQPQYAVLHSTLKHTVALASGANAEGVAAYFETNTSGTSTGHTYGLGSWINIGTAAVPAAGHIHVPLEVGVYEDAATMTNARIVFGIQAQGILTGTPASLHFARINTTKTITALFAAANPGSIAYTAGTGAGTAVGWIAIADIVGVGVVYAKVYSAT